MGNLTRRRLLGGAGAGLAAVGLAPLASAQPGMTSRQESGRLVDRSATSMAAMIRAGEISSEEAVATCLARIEALKHGYSTLYRSQVGHPPAVN